MGECYAGFSSESEEIISIISMFSKLDPHSKGYALAILKSLTFAQEIAAEGGIRDKAGIKSNKIQKSST